MNKMFQRWRVYMYLPKCYMKVTVRDLLWTEERNDAWLDSFCSIEAYNAYREENKVKSHPVPPSLLSLWRLVLCKHYRAWAKAWIGNPPSFTPTRMRP